MNRITPVTDKADTINDRVRIARAALKLSQKEVAARIGKPQNTICEIEQGNRKVPIELIQEYGKQGFDLNWIIYGTTDDNALSDLLNHLDNNKKLLLSIFADLKDLPAEDLMYLQEAIEIYVEHHQKKEKEKAK